MTTTKQLDNDDDDNVEAEPPRIASILATFLSNLVKISAVPKEMSPYSNTGKPSS